MNVGSLFSGIGGIELGFEREGFHTSWFVENNLYCQSILKEHFPRATIYGDIQTIDFSQLEKVQILTGGFPCQDISIAGKGAGIIEGKRSKLWTEYARAVRQIRPSFAVIENVSALTFRGLCNVLSDLAEIGYDAEWFCLQASQFGALHKRERIFIVTYPNKHRFDEGDSSSRSMETQKRKVQESQQVRNRRLYESSTGSTLFITDDWSERIQRFREESLQGQQGFSWCKDIRRLEDLKGRSDIPEPLFRRDIHGIPSELDSNFRIERTKALGNAVVPQVAQFIARRIKELMS